MGAKAEPVSAKGNPALISLDGQPNIRVDTVILLLGRSAECDVVVDSKKVSRKHCCLAVINDHLIVKDLGSTNGLKLNGQRRDECKVYEGDELTIADLHYRFQWEKAEGADPAAADNAEKSNGIASPRDAREVKRANPSDSVIERCDQPILLFDEDASPPPGQEPSSGRRMATYDLSDKSPGPVARPRT